MILIKQSWINQKIKLPNHIQFIWVFISNIIHIKERGTWKDACLFLLQKVLNKETQFNGITLVVKKQRFFNLKVSTTGKNEELDLPEYFCKSKFMMNNEREKQVVKKKRY